MTPDYSLTEIHITKPLTSKTIVELMEEYPNLEKITCSKSLYNRISKKYLDALEELEIQVEIDYNWGRKPKYSEELGNKVIGLINSGKDPLEIAEALEISLKTVYYLKDKFSKNKLELKRGRKEKYSSSLRNKIKNSYENGISAKEISIKENIPLRSVYHIIKSE